MHRRRHVSVLSLSLEGKTPPQHVADCTSDWIWWVLVVFVWSSVVLTVYSGLVYVRIAVRLLTRRREPHLRLSQWHESTLPGAACR